MLARRTPEARSEHGAIMVWFALIIVVLLAIGALAIDLGYAYTVKRQLATAADAAALAGAQEAGRKFKEVGGCGDALDSLVAAQVNATYTANSPQGSDGNPTTTVSCFDKDGNATTSTDAASVQVKVDDSSTLQTWFARLLGVSTMNPAASATARVFGANNLGGLRPFVVCMADAHLARVASDSGLDQTFLSYYAHPNSNATPTGLASIEFDRPWDATTDRITTNKNNVVNDGEYVYMEVTGADAPTGYYYTTRDTKTTFHVSKTWHGATTAINTPGTVDIFRMPAPVGGGSSNWGINGIVNAPAHGLVNGDYVRVSVLSAGGAADGYYYVTDASTDTFKLVTDDGSSATPTSAVTINVYKLPSAGVTAGDCNPTTTAANWGYSAFDYPGANDPQLECLIEYGYGGGKNCPDSDPPGVYLGEETNGVPASGDNGNNFQANKGGPLLDDLLGQVILLPVGTAWSEAGGGGAKYSGRGAVAVTFCGYIFPKVHQPDLDHSPHNFDPTCGDEAQYQEAVAKYPDKFSNTSLVIQWRYEDNWVTSYIGQSNEDPADLCRLDGDSCVASLQLLK